MSELEVQYLRNENAELQEQVEYLRALLRLHNIPETGDVTDGRQ